MNHDSKIFKSMIKKDNLARKRKMKQSKIYRILMLMLLTMVGSGMSVWGNETDKSSFSQSEFSNNTLTFTGNHVSITLTGSTSAPLTYGDNGHFKLKQECSKNEEVSYTLSITANTGSTAKITAASVWGYGMHAGSPRSITMKWENYTPVSVNKDRGKEVSISNISKDKLILTCKSTVNLDWSKVNFFIDRIRVTYTVTPDTPGLSTTTETIDVTTDTNSPKSVLLTKYFTTNDHFGNYWNFSILQNPNNAGAIANNTFYATKAGTYKVAANIAALNGCHESSAQSAALTIIVNRIPGSITATDASTYVNDGMNLSNCVTSSLGTGDITYEVTSENATDATITGEEFIAQKAGTYTIKATKAQDDQYNTASTTFSVNVSKKDQTLTFTSASYDKNIVLGSTVTGALTATASSGLTNFTYLSSNNNVVSVNESGDVTAASLANDDITITVTQPGNDEYNPASITRDFHVISKKETTFTPSGFTGTSPTIHVGDQPTIEVKDEGVEFTCTSSNPEVVRVSKDGNIITLTALKEGVSTVTLDQPETSTHSAATQTYTITVEKISNTLQLTLATQSAQVDGTIQVNRMNQNNATTPIEARITNQVFSSQVNKGENVITYENGTITACNAGTAKITFTQAATDTYEGFPSATFDITVTKIANPIAITLNGGSATAIKLKYGQTATLSYSSAHSDADINVTKTSGNYTTLSGTTITAGNAAGTDLYAVTQAETYKYEKGYATFSVRANNTSEEEMYIINDASEYKKLALTTLKSYSFDGHPGDVVKFEAKRDGSNSGFYLEYSTDNGATWHEKWYFISTTSDWQTYTVPLPEDVAVTNIRFELYAGSTLNKYISNVKVTRKTYLKATVDKTDMGTIYTGNTAQATFTVNYSTTNGGKIMLNSSNAHFVTSDTELATTQNSDGTKTFTVTYTPSPNALGAEEAVITVDDLFYSQQFTLTATADKRANTLSVISSQNLMVDAEVTHVYAHKNSEATLSTSLSKKGVITFDASTNTVKAVGAGEATLTLTQDPNDTHHGTTQRVTFTVSKHDQSLYWVEDLSNEQRTLKIGDELSTNTAKATSGLSVTYSSSNEDVLQVNSETGEITARAAGSNIAVTATQSGNYKYNEATSITRYFTVISKINATVSTSLQTEGTNTLTVGEEPATIGCNALITEDCFTIDGNENDIITTSFANNTLTITPLKAGTVTITFSRAEDDGYNALSQSYTIEVVNAVLTLNPAIAPEINFTEYSQITLQRTLKVGHSTLTLPFDTSISDLAGDDSDAYVAQLALATYNHADGYTLYFRKVENGTIQANQPYLLYLTQEVSNRIFTHVTASIPEEIVITQNGWTMHGNYTPDTPMSGHYGMAGGKLCLGGSNATLNAYTAYFEAPATTQHVRVRVAVEDGNGNTTWLGEMNDEEETVEAVYGLDGMKLGTMRHGVNIVRQKDGTVKKIWKK